MMANIFVEDGKYFLIQNYQCGNLNSVVFNQDTAQVSLLSTRNRLNMAEQKLATEIDSYFKDHLIYKRNRRMGGRVIGNFTDLFSRKSDSTIANVRLSVCLLPKPLSLSELLLSAIEPINNQPIDHRVYQTSSISSSGLLLRLLILLACFVIKTTLLFIF